MWTTTLQLWYDSLMGEIQLVESTYVIKQARFRHFVDEAGMPWFVAKDVCDYLEIGNVSQACDRLFADTVRISSVDTDAGSRDMNTISEPGLYQLIFQSRKPEAEAFQRWVFTELLPQLRRDGFYRLKGRMEVEPMYAGKPVTPTRFGRQPFLDVLRERGIKNDDALNGMNALDMPADVPKINTTYMDQVRGRSYVKPALAYRASVWLSLPVESLFTEASRARLSKG